MVAVTIGSSSSTRITGLLSGIVPTAFPPAVAPASAQPGCLSRLRNPSLRFGSLATNRMVLLNVGFSYLASMRPLSADRCLLSPKAPASAEQVDVRAHFRQRIARRIDAINRQDAVEGDFPPVRHLVARSVRVIVPNGISWPAVGRAHRTGSPGNLPPRLFI